MVSAAAVLCLGGVLAPLVALLHPPTRRHAKRRWFGGLLAAFGVKLRLEGHPPGESARPGMLVVANHVSWLDVLALQAVTPMRMVAKAEMRRWPVLGMLAARAGTLFIDRTRPRELPRTVAHIAEQLRIGALIGAFPEGTTWCGRAAGRWRPAVFQAALDSGARIQPVMLRYRFEDGRGTTVPAFVGEATLLGSIREVVRARGLVVELVLARVVTPASVVPNTRPAATARRALARRCAEPASDGNTENHWTSPGLEVAGSGSEHSPGSGHGPIGQLRPREPERDRQHDRDRKRTVGSDAA